MSTLTVHTDFHKYSRGDQISDPEDVTAVLASHPQFVTRVVTPEPVALQAAQDKE